MRVQSNRSTAGSLALATVLVLSVVAAGCGSSSRQSADNVISAGQVDLQLPPGWTVTKNGKGAIRPASDNGSASGSTSASGGSGGSTEDTIPLAKQDPTTALFTALSTFQACLQGSGVKFIGAPDQSNPNSPTNDPNYIKGLSTCAAKSNIVQALKSEQTAQQNLTPAQIQTENKGYLKWRDCMIGRGWGIPKPTPDSRGLLASFGGSSGTSAPAFTPPPGQSLLNSPDMQACAAQSAKEVPQASSGG